MTGWKFTITCNSFVGIHQAQPHLQSAITRALNPFRPNTKTAYIRQFKLFLAYSVKNRVKIVLCVFNLLMFCGWLYQAQFTPRNICNHVTAVKSMLKLYLLPHHWIDHPLIANYMRSITINTRTPTRVKGTFTLHNILHISQVLTKCPLQHHYRTAFLLSFMAFLRISNLVPPVVRFADASRQVTWNDITFTRNGAVINIKWAKNMQEGYRNKQIHIPAMGNMWLCPVLSLKKLHEVEKHGKRDLLMKKGDTVLTESNLRKTLSMVLKILGIDHTTHTYHCFRRSGASIAFNQNVNFESIKAQGGWQSDSIWAYLFNHSEDITAIPKMFQNLEEQLCLGQNV